LTDWLTHFRLKADPFDPLAASLSPFLGEPYRSTVLRLEQALERRRGWIHVIGEPGVGKTTVVQAVIRDFEAYATVAVSACANLSERVMTELLVGDHAPPGGSSTAAKRGMLISLVKAARMAGRPIIVFVDDVDHAYVKDLESLRMALNVDPAVAEIIQVIIAGRERFAGALQGRAARGVASRIGVRIALPKMTNERVGEFITGCLKAAGCKRPKEILTPDALAVIAACSDGLAGRCAMLARESLRRAAAAKADCVDPVMVREAVQMIGVATRSSKGQFLHLLRGRASRYAVLVSTAVAGTFLLLPLLRASRLDDADRLAAASKRVSVVKPDQQAAVATVSAIAVDEHVAIDEHVAADEHAMEPRGADGQVGDGDGDGRHGLAVESPANALPIVVPLATAPPAPERSRGSQPIDLHPGSKDKPSTAGGGRPVPPVPIAAPSKPAPVAASKPSGAVVVDGERPAATQGSERPAAEAAEKATAVVASARQASTGADELVGPVAPRNRVAAATPEPTSGGSARDRDAATPATTAATETESADVMPGFSSAISLQVGAYTSKSRADSVRARLSKQFSGVYVEETSTGGGKPVFRVRIGRYVDGEQMKAAEARLAAAGVAWYRAPVP